MSEQRITIKSNNQKYKTQIIKSLCNNRELGKKNLAFMLFMVLIITFFSFTCLFHTNKTQAEMLSVSESKVSMISKKAEEKYLKISLNKEEESGVSVKVNPHTTMPLSALSPLSRASVEDSPLPYAGPRIVVNVAARKLRLYEGDTVIKTYPVAVGSPRYRTPLGPRQMYRIVWNPWWIPPRSSAWARKERKTPPGRKNPLGPVKMKLGDGIMFHGTTSPWSVGRAASHGCMRMHSNQAKELARYIQQRIIGDTSDATYAQYERNRRRSYYINLPVKVPVNIIYEIAEIEDGKLHIYKDIYRRIKDKLSAVRFILVRNGYDPEKFKMSYLKRQIKIAANRKDLTFALSDINTDKTIMQSKLEYKKD
jgi:lipoprotein-anchoring transpeptidase ErfK/SrfK